MRAAGADCGAAHPSVQPTEASGGGLGAASAVAAADPFAVDSPGREDAADVGRGDQDGAAVTAALAFAVDYCDAAGGARPGMCYPASWNIRDQFGFDLVQGQRGGIPHTWNVLPDGRILDATAAQFGDPGPGLYPGTDPRYVR